MLNSKKNKIYLVIFSIFIINLQPFTAIVNADTLSTEQINALKAGELYFNVEDCTDSSSVNNTSNTTGASGSINNTDVVYTDSSRSGRQVGATIYSPSDGKAHPLIMFAPGRFQNSRNNGFYARYLNSIAQKGFTVVGANFPDNNVAEAVPSDALDIKFLITQIESDSKYSSIIDTSNGVGMIGHSDGGMVAMLDGYAQGIKDDRISAVMAEDGAWYGGYTQTSGPPLLLMHGSNDQIQNISSSQQLFTSIKGPYQAFATITGADHYHYIIDTSSQFIPVVDGLTSAFFTRILIGDISDATSLSAVASKYPTLVNLQQHGTESAIAVKGTASSSNVSSQCCGKPSIGGPSQGGPLLDVQFPQVSDTAALATNIDNYVKSAQPNSPFIGQGATFVAAGQKYGVNPALMVAIAQKESSLGLNQDNGSYDAWGLTAKGDVANYPYQNGEYYFPSWTVGIYESSKYVGDNYAVVGGSLYSTTVEQLMTHYTPGDVINQTNITLGVMGKIVAGLSISGGNTSNLSSTSNDTITLTDNSGCGSSSSSTSANGLTNPFPAGWTPNRLDLGYDGHFIKEIVAPCNGTMSYVDADSNHGSNGGWEGAYFTIKCTQQPNGLPSDTFYFAEGVSPTVTQGQTVNAGQQIGQPGWTGYSEGPGGIEWGLAVSNNPREAYAASLGNSCATGSASQKFVQTFSQWVQKNLNVAAPSATDNEGCN